MSAAIKPYEWIKPEQRSVYVEWEGTAVKNAYYFEASPDPVETEIRLDPPLPKSHRLTQVSRAAQGREAKRRMIERALTK